MSKPLKRYYIQVKGFDGHFVEAETAGKAKYAEFKAWKEAGYGRHWNFTSFFSSAIETFHHHGRVKS